MAGLYLLRHAEAVSNKGARFAHDSDRPLSEEGRARMERAARGILHLGLKFDVILTSPCVRARQTAGIVAAAVGCPQDLVDDEGLAPGARWDRVKEVLAVFSSAGSVLLVGHEPDFSRMAAEIVGAGRDSIDFGKGTLACITVDRIPPREPGVLASLLRIEHLAAIAR